MKHLFSAVLLMLCTMAVNAQDYYDDYDYDVAEDVYLTGNQWHTDGYSYLEADNNRYLVVAGDTRFYRTLYRPDIARLQVRFGDVIISYRPFFHAGCLGWYIAGRLRNYFMYPDGRWCYLNFRPVYYDYHYNICGLRHINFYHWHFWSGRHHHRYHGVCYRPPVRHYSRPAPPPRSYNNGGQRSRYTGNNPPSRVSERTAPPRNDVRRSDNTINRRPQGSINRSSSGTGSYSRQQGTVTRGQTSNSSVRRQAASRSGRDNNSSRSDRGNRR